VGIDTLQGTHENPMSAHPKIDQKTGEVFFHGREFMKDFYVARAVDGKIVDRVELDLDTGFHHDLFITENFIVVIDGSTRLNHAGLMSDEALLQFDNSRKLRFGVFRRSAGKMTPEGFKWIEAPMPAELVHSLYAYDEGDKINLWAPLCFFKETSDQDALGVLGGQGPPHMHKLVIDVEEKSVDVELVNGGDTHCSEFPRIRDDRIGLRTQYGYSALQSPGVGEEFNFTGIMKWDFGANRLAGVIQFPDHVVGGEPVFIPSASPSSTNESNDDDGYIGMFLWNYEKAESTYALYDAQSFASKPVVELLVPRRVPMGFHAAWLTEEQFQKQLHTP
jgi:carotenoid cleavage dioxygenase